MKLFRLDRMSVLILLTLLSHALTIGFVKNYHDEMVARRSVTHERAVEAVQSEMQLLKDEVVLLEGASTWEETRFARSRQ